MNLTRLARRNKRETSVDTNHIYCWCDHDRALCGDDLADVPYGCDYPECIVCADLEYFPCERCGE